MSAARECAQDKEQVMDTKYTAPLTRDEALWTLFVPFRIACVIAQKVRDLEEIAEWLPGASIGPVGDGTFYVSATVYMPGAVHSLRPIFHCTEVGCQVASWDDIDAAKRRARVA